MGRCSSRQPGFRLLCHYARRRAGFRGALALLVRAGLPAVTNATTTRTREGALARAALLS